MEHLNGSFLFDSMYAGDVEGNKLACLPSVAELLEAYPSKAMAAFSGGAWAPCHQPARGKSLSTLGLSFPFALCDPGR